MQLRKRHLETQVYVGAFQYLAFKQFHYKKKSPSRTSTNQFAALKNLAQFSKNLLCEIETAINNTGMRMPKVLSRAEMNERLTFHNDGRSASFDPSKIDEIDVDEMDMKFAKVRFSEYLQALQQMLHKQRIARTSTPSPIKPNIIPNKARNRVRQGRKRRKQNRVRNGVVGVRPNAMKSFRRNHRKSLNAQSIVVPNTSSSTMKIPISTTTTTTTVAPHT